MMTGLPLDIRYALRGLRRTPGVFAVALLTIALGVGANTAMFSVLHSVALRPLPYPDADRLVSLWPEKRWSLPMLADVRERVDSYDAIATFTTDTYSLLGDGPAEAIPVGLVSATYFDVLGVRPLLGAGFEPGDEVGERGPVVVLSHAFWQSRFGGDAGVVGRTIRLAGHGLEQRTIAGVLPAGFWPTATEVWVPMIETPGQPGYYSAYGLNAIGRLRAGVTTERASQELRGLVDELTPLHPPQFRAIRYSPVDVVPALEAVVRDVRTQLVVLMGAVGFILLIACTNVANLLLARSHARQREIAVQAALGGTRWRIMRQVLTESTVLGVIGGAVGVAAAYYTLPLITRFVGDQLPRASEIGLDATALGFALAVSLAAGLVFGAAPALRAARAAPGDLIRGGGRGQSQGRTGGRLNDALVCAEIALCLVLLAGAGLMLKSVSQLTRVDPGFRADNVLTMRFTLPPARYDSLPVREILRQQLEEQVAAVPGVAGVASLNYLPLVTGAGLPYSVAGMPESDDVSLVVSARVVAPAFFTILRMPLVTGRLLGEQDAGFGGENALVVNEAFARQHWPAGPHDALGGRILYSSGEPMGTIVGVVRDARTTQLTAAPEPEIYGSVAQFGLPMSGFLMVRGERSMPTRDAVVRALHAVEPELATRDVRTMDDVVHAAAANTRFYARLLTAFAALALLLGLIGVYGVMSYAVSRRTRELGVRLALGAAPREVVMGVVGRAMAPVALGIAIGFAGALILTRLLASLVFEVNVADPWVLGGVGMLLAAAGAAAAIVPATRAARISPVAAMQPD